MDLEAARLELLRAPAEPVRWFRRAGGGSGNSDRLPRLGHRDWPPALPSAPSTPWHRLCRHPDLFKAAVALSGTYDLEKLFGFQGDDGFYFASPLLFVVNLPEGRQLELLRRRFVLLAFGQGRWEHPEESWRMADVLGGKGIPNRVDPWGHEYDHDWPTWRQMLPHYLGQVT